MLLRTSGMVALHASPTTDSGGDYRPMEASSATMKFWLRTAAELSGARFHRAGHVTNVPHVRKTTVISPPVLYSPRSDLRFCERQGASGLLI